MNDKPYGKKLKVFKFSISSSTNPVFSTMLEPFTSLRIKTKISQITQCGYDNQWFELILNNFF